MYCNILLFHEVSVVSIGSESFRTFNPSSVDFSTITFLSVWNMYYKSVFNTFSKLPLNNNIIKYFYDFVIFQWRFLLFQDLQLQR